MTLNQLIKQLEDLKLERPDLAAKPVMLVLEVEYNDKTIFVKAEKVSWCYSNGEKPCVEGLFNWDKHYS